MGRKQIIPIFQKVPVLLKLSFLLAKSLKRPIIKNSRKLKNKFNVFKKYNYGGYIREYPFAPSHSPLIFYKRKQYYCKRRSEKDLCSILYLFSCLGRIKDDDQELDGIYNYSMDYHLEKLVVTEDDAVGVKNELIEYSEEDSVDERAEKFIQRFYQEIRMQKRDALLQLEYGMTS